jgi:hypothetical protein
MTCAIDKWGEGFTCKIFVLTHESCYLRRSLIRRGLSRLLGQACWPYRSCVVQQCSGQCLNLVWHVSQTHPRCLQSEHRVGFLDHPGLSLHEDLPCLRGWSCGGRHWWSLRCRLWCQYASQYASHHLFPSSRQFSALMLHPCFGSRRGHCRQ